MTSPGHWTEYDLEPALTVPGQSISETLASVAPSPGGEPTASTRERKSGSTVESPFFYVPTKTDPEDIKAEGFSRHLLNTV